VSDVFISYKREDEKRVAPLVSGLRKAGLSVWWDRDLPGGEAWRRKITEELEAARCVVVVWSSASVASEGEFVHEEAGRAKARGGLLPVRIDPVTAPLGFGQIQSLDLVGWRGNPRALRFRHVVASVKAVIADGPPPRAMTPGRLALWTGAALGVLTVFAAVLGTVADVAGLAKPICRVPGIHALCARWGWGGVPTAAEATLWEARGAGDCSGLRAYLERFPNGAFAEEAGRRLQAVEVVEEERWQLQEYRLPLAVRPALDPPASEEAARADALARAPDDALLVCDGFSAGEYRLLSATPEVVEWRCTARGQGFVCGFDGRALCKVEARTINRREVCE